MFVIFGWNNQQVEFYHPGEQQLCEHCHNTDRWQLSKVSKYFTLFFIPVFAHKVEYWYQCPICDHGYELDKEMFSKYKALAKINTDFQGQRISETERDKRAENIYQSIERAAEDQRLEDLEKSNEFKDQAAAKTNEELLNILKKGDGEYSPAFIIAIENEVTARKL